MEYALIGCIISIAIIAAVGNIGQSVLNLFNRIQF